MRKKIIYALLILVSGTHGGEGYSGSGCHVAWLQERWFERVAPRDTAILFIHAINPHGFAWGRRVNEDNVDLNRNFVDLDRPHPENADYVAIAQHIDPVDWAEPALTAHNIIIVDLYWDNAGEDFVLVTQVSLPVRLDLGLLQADLEEMARDVGYNVRLQHETIFIATNQLRLAGTHHGH